MCSLAILTPKLHVDVTITINNLIIYNQQNSREQNSTKSQIKSCFHDTFTEFTQTLFIHNPETLFEEETNYARIQFVQSKTRAFHVVF